MPRDRPGDVPHRTFAPPPTGSDPPTLSGQRGPEALPWHWRTPSRVPPWQGSGGTPQPSPSWGPAPPRVPLQFSWLCAGALAAAAASAVTLAVERDMYGRFAYCACFTFVLAIAALGITRRDPVANRWMAGAALVAAATPYLPVVANWLVIGFALSL